MLMQTLMPWAEPRPGSTDGGQEVPGARRRSHLERLHFSSACGTWATPRAVFEALDAEFGFTLDAAASAHNALCERYYTAHDNALWQPWTGVVWVNPPYGRALGRWMQKGYRASLEGATVVMLVPARTDTQWWHTYVMRGEVRFLRGRLRFGDAASSAPFPSAIVIFHPQEQEV